MNRVSKFLAILIFVSSCTFVSADNVDNFIHQWMKRKQIPGVALLVVKDGRALKSQGYGFANIELQAPVKPETIFQSGSVGKQFTATAIMMLVEEGKIALDDPIRKYLPVPETWSGITIRHMLTHTSGLGDYPDTVDFRKDYTEDEEMQMVMKTPLLFKPGEQWSYSNLAYLTLGVLVRKITGQFYGDFLQERIFHPLGMNSTRIISESDIIPNRAAGYQLVKNEIKNQDWVSPTLNTTADGALYFNIVDLAKWDAALYTEKLLKKESLDQMWTPVKLSDGSTYPYGFGWSVGEYHGHRRIEHGGSWQGFRAHIARYVDDHFTVVALTNSAEANPDYAAHAVAGLYIPAVALPRHSTVKIDPKLLQLYAGKYDYGQNVVAEITAGENKLIVKTGQTTPEYLPESKNAFYREDSETVIRFVTDVSGKVTHIEIDSGSGPVEKMNRIP